MNYFLCLLISVSALFIGPLGATENTLPLIPKPEKISYSKGTFMLNAQTAVIADASLKSEAELAVIAISKSTSFWHRILNSERAIKRPVVLTVDESLPSGYQIAITPEKATLIGKDQISLTHAIHTFGMILPKPNAMQQVLVPCVTVTDNTGLLSTRGLRLDLASHLFPAADLKRIIDELSRLKLNTLILQLNGEGGWRLQIPSRPKLTEIGATRTDWIDETKQYSGHYTAEQFKELSSYAAARKVRLIPSFVFPAQSEPILRSLPELKSMNSEEAKTLILDIFQEVAKAFSLKEIELQTDPDYFQSHLQPALEKYGLTRINSSAWKIVNLAPWQHPPGLVGKGTGAPGEAFLDHVYATTIDSQNSGLIADLNTRYVKDFDELTYTLFPRLAAIAELAWNGPGKIEDFSKRWTPAQNYYLQEKIRICPLYLSPKRKAAYGTRVESTFAIDGNKWPELAVDGRRETFFQSSNGAKKGDTMTFHFPVALRGAVEVATGGPNGGELEDGILETSVDGKNWEALAEFFDGLIVADLPPKTKHLRIRVTGAQKAPVILYEIRFTKALLVPDFTETRQLSVPGKDPISLTFKCDFTGHPELADKIEIMSELYFESHQKIIAALWLSERSDVPLQYQFSLEQDSEDPLKNPKNLAQLSKEQTQLRFSEQLIRDLANYPDDEPSWFLTGTIHLIQHQINLLPELKSDKTAPLSGGVQTAAFFHWCQKTIGERQIPYLSFACSEKLYRDKLWQDVYQLSLSQLLEKYRSENGER